MLKVYLDLGEKKDDTDDIVCVASVVFKPTPYKQFVRPWNRMLRRWGASAFHATDFYSGCEEFRRDTPQKERLFEDDCRTIPNLIGSRAERITLISFRPLEFRREMPRGWAEKFGTSLHSQAVQICLISNGSWIEKRPRESFQYFMESGDVEEGAVSSVVGRMRKDERTSKQIKVASFTTVNKGGARGLEAADFAAWHWNKHYMDKVRKGKHDWPRKDFEAFVDAASVGDRIKYIFLSGAELKVFFSQVPREALKG